MHLSLEHHPHCTHTHTHTHSRELHAALQLATEQNQQGKCPTYRGRIFGSKPYQNEDNAPHTKDKEIIFLQTHIITFRSVTDIYFLELQLFRDEMHSHSRMCRKRRPKNKDRRPKTLWSKTKTHWSKTKTHWSKPKTHWSKTKTHRSKTKTHRSKTKTHWSKMKTHRSKTFFSSGKTIHYTKLLSFL